MGCACFGLKYSGLDLEHWLGRHPVFREGPKIEAENMLYTEYKACAALGLDFSEYEKKDRYTKMLIVGGYVAESALSSMRQWDMAKEREMKAEAQKNRKR